MAKTAGNGRVDWQSSKVRWFVGTNRMAAADSLLLGPSSVTNAWNRSSIGTGDSLRSSWNLTAFAPFEAELDLVAGGQHSPVRIACGPKPADVPSQPTVTTVTVTPSAGDVEVGDTVTVRFTAQSDAGLWVVTALGTGTCEFQRFFPGRFANDLSGTAKFVVKPGCQHNGEISFGAVALDGVLHAGSKEGANLVFTDPEPPELLASVHSQIHLHTDTLCATLYASDSVGLKDALFEFLPGGLRDSANLIPVGTKSYRADVRLGLREALIGTEEVRITVRDVSGRSSIPVTRPTLLVREIQRLLTTRTIPVEAADARIDHGRGVVYAISPTSGSPTPGGRMWTIPLTGGGAITETALPYPSLGLDLTPSGDTLVFAFDDRVGFTDLRSLPLSFTSVPITATTEFPLKWISALDGGHVFLTSNFEHLVEYTLGAGTQQARTDGGGNSNISGRSLDGRVFITGHDGYMRRWEAGANTFSDPKDRPGEPVMDLTGSTVVIYGKVYNAALDSIGYVRVFGEDGVLAGRALLSPDGATFYQASERRLLRNRVSDGAVLDGMRLSFTPKRIRMSRDGNFLVMVHHSEGKISTLDLR